ncbi:MAG: alkaline phosphatase family protein [archaeon]|nr:alkaline phosphatase family protein [archaeon]
MKFLPLLVIVGLSLEIYYPPSTVKNAEKEITNFYFGSNYFIQHYKKMDIFEKIKRHNPQLWIWLGNAVQLGQRFYWKPWKTTEPIPNKNFQVYQKLKENQFYKGIEETTKVIGVWDDMDYGFPYGTQDFADKEISKKAFLDFLDVPANEERREAGRGLYTTYSFGEGERSVRFILLDTRYHKNAEYGRKDILGEKQWDWLENVLSSSNEVFTFIVSATQILPFNRMVDDAWDSHSRKRLISVLEGHKKSGVVFLSGGTGFAQVTKTPCVLKEIGYTLYEFTSSGLSYSIGKNKKFIYDKILPNNFNDGEIFAGINFGEVKIHWGSKKEEASLEINILDENENVQRTKTLSYSDLFYNYEKVFDSEKKEKKCYLRVTKRYKYLYEYLLPKTCNDAAFIGLFTLAVILCCLIFWYLRTSIYIIISTLLIAGILMKLYEMKENREFKEYLE